MQNVVRKSMEVSAPDARIPLLAQAPPTVSQLRRQRSKLHKLEASLAQRTGLAKLAAKPEAEDEPLTGFMQQLQLQRQMSSSVKPLPQPKPGVDAEQAYAALKLGVDAQKAYAQQQQQHLQQMQQQIQQQRQMQRQMQMQQQQQMQQHMQQQMQHGQQQQHHMQQQHHQMQQDGHHHQLPLNDVQKKQLQQQLDQQQLVVNLQQRNCELKQMFDDLQNRQEHIWTTLQIYLYKFMSHSERQILIANTDALQAGQSDGPTRKATLEKIDFLKAEVEHEKILLQKELEHLPEALKHQTPLDQEVFTVVNSLDHHHREQMNGHRQLVVLQTHKEVDPWNRKVLQDLQKYYDCLEKDYKAMKVQHQELTDRRRQVQDMADNLKLRVPVSC